MSIGDGAFYACSGLTYINIPNSVTSIGDGAFYYCSGLASITIPNNVKKIGNYAFSGCSALSSISIPNSVASIGNYVFDGCSSISSVYIEDSESSLSLGYNSSGKGLFYDCPIETLYLGRNLEYSTDGNPFANITSIKHVEIGNSVTSIGNSAFNGCSGITSISIGKNVTSIGEKAFYGCLILSTIKCYAENPPTIYNSETLYGVPQVTCLLYVPCGCSTAYRSVPYWNNFLHIIEMSQEDTIERIEKEETEVSTQIYDLNGKSVNEMSRKGFYIVNGKKVIVR